MRRGKNGNFLNPINIKDRENGKEEPGRTGITK